jgi:tRNA-dihydrouridine synthase A
MLGLFHGQPGGRIWRRILTVESVKEGAGREVLDRALDSVRAALERAPRRDA